jgi:hypothetical protein
VTDANEPAPGDPGHPTDPEATAAREHDRDRTLTAVHRVEYALGSAAPGRSEAWRRGVIGAFDDLDQATAEEEANAARPDSLLSDIARNYPRLRHRVHGLRIQYANAREAIQALRRELADTHHEPDVADIRQRAGWVLAALRYQRARESDLIYEALAESWPPEDDQPARR